MTPNPQWACTVQFKWEMIKCTDDYANLYLYFGKAQHADKRNLAYHTKNQRSKGKRSTDSVSQAADTCCRCQCAFASYVARSWCEPAGIAGLQRGGSDKLRLPWGSKAPACPVAWLYCSRLVAMCVCVWERACERDISPGLRGIFERVSFWLWGDIGFCWSNSTSDQRAVQHFARFTLEDHFVEA